MEIPSAFASGVQGFQNATETANQAAIDIVASTVLEPETPTNNTFNNSSPNLTEAIVDLKVAEYQGKASAEVIKTADEMLGTLIDVSV